MAKMIIRLRGSALAPSAVVVGSLVAGAIYSWVMGQDANWDWQNYHEYNVWAVINGRYDIDAIPPGFQTYFNPVVYFPWYYLRHFLPLPYGGLIMGAVHGLNLALIWRLSRVLLGDAANGLTVAASVLLAAFGPMTLSEVGTSFSDILTALPIIAGVSLLLSAEQSHPARAFFLAGLLIGAAVGLKLTNVVYAIGAAAALLASARPALALGCLALGGAIGSAATGGAWSLMLWREFGNPVFPLFNGFFPSPELKDVNILDRQFAPRGLLDALAYPFYWLVGDPRSSEFDFRDARFALLFIAVPVAIVARLRSASNIFTRRDLQFLAFFAVSYAAWLGLFSIQRYAIVMELVCGPAIVLLLARILTAPGFEVSPRGLSMRPSAAILAIAAVTALWTQPGDWWRRPWDMPYRPAISERLRQPAIYMLLDKPLGYIAPLLPPQSRFYQLADIALPILPNGMFDRRIRAGLAEPLPGGVWELHLRDRAFRKDLLDGYGLAIDPSQACVEIEGVVPGSAIEACPLAVGGK
jgi:Glycosyltransferase family 87